MQNIKYTGNKNNYTLSYEDEDLIKELLMFHKIIKVENDTFYLDNGTELEIVPNEGCGGCGNGWYDIEEIAKFDNAITNVTFDYNDDDGSDHFQIFVYAEDTRFKILDVSGYDNGYYGQGYEINVKIQKELVLDKSEEDIER